MKMCEQIFKKRQRPNTIQILWIVKNQEKANNRPSYSCAAIKKKKSNIQCWCEKINFYEKCREVGGWLLEGRGGCGFCRVGVGDSWCGGKCDCVCDCVSGGRGNFDRLEGLMSSKFLEMTFKPWILPSVLNYYTLHTTLLLKSIVRKQKSTFHIRSQWSKTSQISSHDFSLKKPVESLLIFAS